MSGDAPTSMSEIAWLQQLTSGLLVIRSRRMLYDVSYGYSRLNHLV